MTEFFEYFFGFTSTTIQVGWPLLILASGLGWVAYFEGKDRIKTAGGWALALVGLILFVWNLKR
jgi:hypothetical protein